MRGLDMAFEEGLNVKLVLIPDKEDPDSYVQKLGTQQFRNFIQENKKDFILFQLETSLKDAGNDAAKKSNIVNQIAETISKIDKAEDFTKQQEYIRQSANLLKVDEAGFINLVNKFIRDRISLAEKKLPFEEAKYFEEKAKEGEANDYDENTFSLLYKDELQEKEIARVLLELGEKVWNDDQTVAEYILSELPEEELFQNEMVLRFIHNYKFIWEQSKSVDKSLLIYHEDPAISAFTVSLLYYPYEESSRWKNEFSKNTGYQKKLFEQDYKDFIRVIHTDNKEELSNFLETQRDNSHEQVESAISYLKLRKIKKLLIQNQADMETASNENFKTLILTHQFLKQQEIELTRKLGSVIVR
jgi:DNA primase